jgi:hypothetical protein
MIRCVVGTLVVLYCGFAVLLMASVLFLYGWERDVAALGLAYGTMLASALALLRGREWGRNFTIVALFVAAAFYGVQEWERQRRGRSYQSYPMPPAQVSVALVLMGVALLHRSVRGESEA